MAAEWCDYIDSVNIHEMAHSYFGDAVVCRHFEHSWLKESWATYVETVWLEEKRSIEEAHYDLHLNALRYFDEVGSKYARPIVTRTYNSSWDLFDAHLYPGGAWRIHMLRNRTGDEAFWKATRDYLESYSGKFVETEDFRRKLEEHSGLNLVRFFDQWIYGRGYPKLKASFSHDAEKSQGTLVVEQTQKEEKKEIGLFAFPLDVEYTDDEGAHRITLEIEGERTTTILPVKGKPTQIRFDPGCKALFSLEFNPGADLLKSALTKAPDIRSRIHAAKELIKTGRRPSLEAVRDAMRNEPFWGVRAAVARELGEAKVAATIEPLATLLKEEDEPRVKRALALACSKMRDPRLRDALLAFLEQGQPPWARGQALEALGSQQDENDLDLLAKATSEEGLHRLAACGALRGLGGLRSSRAFDLLEEMLAYGVTAEPARRAAVQGYAHSASLLERERRERAVDRLADLTRDGNQHIRMHAAIGLGTLGMGRAVPALQALKRAMPAQEEPRIDRIVAHLRKGSPGEQERKLREQVEKLEETCRKLDERLQGLEAATEKAP
jgi:aminopeptidase N